MSFFVLSRNLDLVGFLAVAVLALATLDFCVRRAAKTRGLGRWAWGGLLVVLACGTAAAVAAGRGVDRHFREMIGGFAPTYADEMARLGHASITPDTKADDPTYLALIAAEMRWLKTNAFAGDIYTFGRKPDGSICLLVDSETDYDHNGVIEGEREQRTAIGEAYDKDTDLIGRAFAGEGVFTDSPTTDRWGTWMSTYVPVRADDGRVVAVLGIDYPADQWVQSILVHRAAMLGLGGTVAAALAAAAATTRVVRAEAKAREAMHLAAATHDGLTGLPNRALLHDRIARVVATVRRRPGAHAALLFLDFDGFKAVNDTLGHAAGDQLLRAIAGRLTATLRATDGVTRLSAGRPDAVVEGSDVVDADAVEGAEEERFATAARLGGDEFCVLLPDLRQASDATAVADRLLAALRPPHRLAGKDVTSTASIGVAVVGGEGEGVAEAEPSPHDVEQLLRDADAAMYRAKRAGGGRWMAHRPTAATDLAMTAFPPPAASSPLPPGEVAACGG